MNPYHESEQQHKAEVVELKNKHNFDVPKCAEELEYDFIHGEEMTERRVTCVKAHCKSPKQLFYEGFYQSNEI